MHVQISGLHVALLLDSVCHYKAYRENEQINNVEEKDEDIQALTEIENQLKQLFNEFIKSKEQNNEHLRDNYFNSLTYHYFVELEKFSPKQR